MSDFPRKLEKIVMQRKKNAALRTLNVSEKKVDFSSNDYLGFAREYEIYENTLEYLKKNEWQRNGASGSRLLSGNYPLYEQVEKEINAFYKAEAALIFNSGYNANLGLFATVPQKGDFIFYDELIHASIRDGIRMSAAKAYKFAHNNLEDLMFSIQRNSLENTDSEIYIVTESVFSMDGDSPDLLAFSNFCTTHGYRFIVDEAHAIGIFGEMGSGRMEEFNVNNQIFARVITFGKSFGCHGAAVLGSNALKEYLINFARSFIYTTALPPHALATIFVAHDFFKTKKGKHRQKQLLETIHFFKQELKKLKLEPYFIPSESGIQCCKIAGNQNVQLLAKLLQEKNFDVRAIMAPTVPSGEERIRICLHSFNTQEEIKSMLSLLPNFMEIK